MLQLRLWKNASLHTLESEKPRATAMVTMGPVIMAVGDHNLANEWHARVDETIDLAGRHVVPGMTDSHIHFVEHGQAKLQIALELCNSPQEVIAEVTRCDHPDEGWIIGRGFQVNRWREGVAPHRSLLDEHFPDRPVLLHSRCGHQIWVNSAAMRAAKITDGTVAPEGGVVVRDDKGIATGVFQEEAINLITSAEPDPTEAQLRHAINVATEDLWSKGIVAVHAPEGRENLALLSRMRQDGELMMRTFYLPPFSMAEELVEVGQVGGLGDRWFRLGALKIFTDGAIGSATALMHEPYSNNPENFGVMVVSPDQLKEMVEFAHAHRWRLAIHAIGDRCVDYTVDTLAASQAKHGTTRETQGIWDRIEHMQCLTETTANRAAKARIGAMMQPIHLFDDWRPAKILWGERTARTYACRTLLDAGVPIALGSDSPVASANPFKCIHSAVARTDMEGEPKGGWHIEQAITASESLHGYCTVPAQMAGESRWRGQIRPGHLADFVVLSDDPFAPDLDWREMQAEMTVVDGAVVYDRQGMHTGQERPDTDLAPVGPEADVTS